MKYRLRHATRYAYAKAVTQAAHLAHLSPCDCAWQRVQSSRLEISPRPEHKAVRQDWLGNATHWVFIDQPHGNLEVVLSADIDVLGQVLPAEADTPAWEDVREAARRARGAAAWAAEFLYASPMLKPFAGGRDYAAVSFTPGRPILAAAMDLTLRMRRDFAFKAGITEIGTPLSQVLAQKAGVCQDFSHLMITGLRGLGLPARYASGYIRTRPPPGQTRRRGADQSHAWVSVWLGPAHGWADVDPTNGIAVSNEHVLLGYGRDFSDVSPLSGVILGGGAHSVHVGVDLDPLEAGT